MSTYQVTNNTSSPRLIFHAGQGNAHGGTLIERGATVTVKMTKAEAENAETPGLEIVKGDTPPTGDRIFLAVADDAEGAGFDHLRVRADKFIGLAIGSTEPQGPAAYRWQRVTTPAADFGAGAPVEPVVEPAPEPEGDKAPDVEPAPTGEGEEPPEPAKAVHRGAGSYSVMRGDTELVEHLKKADAEAFNDLDDEAKEAFITERAKPAE